jgi:ATP-dependent RNA helicase RhlE
MTFTQLGLIDPILKALDSEGYSTPTPIQSQTIPIALAKRDVLGCAQTGTGKTAAFALPIIQLLSANPPGQKRKIKSLIITPTRELATQISESFAVYGQHLNLKHTVIFGGVGQAPQVDKLTRGLDILIATPGRLLDLYNQGYIDLGHVEIFVLDEADRMLDMGFVHDIKKVIKLLPVKRQSLFFSATMPPVIMQLASSILIDPTRVEVTPVSSTAEKIQQKLYYVDQGNKIPLLIDLLQDRKMDSVLIFTRTKHGADKLVKQLLRVEIKAMAIHGNKSQNNRQLALSNFKDKKIRVLVATDIAARGIDIDELAYVINFEIPNIPETYVHRIGRTGRAGASGTAISFCDREEMPFILDIQKLIKMFIPEIKDHAYLPEVLYVDVTKHIAKQALKKPSMDHNRPPRTSGPNGRQDSPTAKPNNSAPNKKKKFWRPKSNS